MAKHKCPNRFGGKGARGGSFFEIESPSYEHSTATLRVGHSCVIVHDREIPITWLSELVAIATEHKGGIPGFLRDHNWSGDSYALMCDPAKEGAR
ncbi:hypothetical protein [Sagittula sp. S175]|uniref:hypothetical protein n=1 Tax=Sagittula sp. S175 TaxID=3415129 RepID=UPI003C7AAA78